MATINNVYVWVETENINRSSSIPQHPVETGLPITDNVRKEPKSLSINGKIVDTENLKAQEIIDKIEGFKDGGSLIKYIGNDVLGNYLISSFNTTKDKSISGGANFDMELVEVRITKSAYDPSKQKAAEEKKQTINPTLKAGATVVFKGGSVYVSSDATKAAATRGRSTCKIEIPNSNSSPIRTESWAIHPIHLVSTDGGKVYGWVDKENIEGTGSSGTAPTTNSGTQQVTKKTTQKPVTAAETPKTTIQSTVKLSVSLLIVIGKTKAEVIPVNEWDNTVTIMGVKYYHSTSQDLYYLSSAIKERDVVLKKADPLTGKLFKTERYIPVNTSIYKPIEDRQVKVG